MPYKNKEDRKKSLKKYSKTDKYKETQKRHKQTEKYKNRILFYRQSGKLKRYQEKYKEKYRQSGKQKEKWKNYIEKQDDSFFQKRKIYNRDYKKTDKYKEYLKKYYEDPINLEKRRNRARKYRNKRIKEDINFRIRIRISKRLNIAIKNNQKEGSVISDLGCKIPELKTYLENNFKEGMTWDNWGLKGWHIDHIIPLSSFDLTNREEFLRAVNYKNLQPLWAVENLKKGNKIIK